MKNKKGFTLVELLAVIVILAIILIIAVPIVLKQIKQSKQNSHVLSANELAKSAKTKALEDDLDLWDLGEDGICEDLVDEACDDIDGGELFYDEDSDTISGYIDFDDEYDVTIYEDVAEAFSEEEQGKLEKNNANYYGDADYFEELKLTYSTSKTATSDDYNVALTGYYESNTDKDLMTENVLKYYNVAVSLFENIINNLKSSKIDTCKDFKNNDSYLECSKLDYNNDEKITEDDKKILENKSNNSSTNNMQIDTDLLGLATKEYDLNGDGITDEGEINIITSSKLYGAVCKNQPTKDRYIVCTKVDYTNDGVISPQEIGMILLAENYKQQTTKYTLDLTLFD